MTPQEIRDAIAASPVLQALVATGNHQAVADALSVGRTKLGAYEVGKGDVLSALGLEVGNALLDLIDTAPQFRHAKHLLEAGRLRVDAPLTVAVLESLAGQQFGGITFSGEHVDAILAVARVPDPVTHQRVTAAVRGEA